MAPNLKFLGKFRHDFERNFMKDHDFDAIFDIFLRFLTFFSSTVIDLIGDSKGDVIHSNGSCVGHTTSFELDLLLVAGSDRAAVAKIDGKISHNRH